MQTANICGVNRDTVCRYYNLFRRAILSEIIRKTKREIRGGGGDLASRTSARGGCAESMVVLDCSKKFPMPIIMGLIFENSTIYTDERKAYDGIVSTAADTTEYSTGRTNLQNCEFFVEKQCNLIIIFFIYKERFYFLYI